MAKARRNFAKHVPATCGGVAAPEQKIKEELAEFAPGATAERGTLLHDE